MENVRLYWTNEGVIVTDNKNDVLYSEKHSPWAGIPLGSHLGNGRIGPLKTENNYPIEHHKMFRGSGGLCHNFIIEDFEFVRSGDFYEAYKYLIENKRGFRDIVEAIDFIEEK